MPKNFKARHCIISFASSKKTVLEKKHHTSAYFSKYSIIDIPRALIGSCEAFDEDFNSIFRFEKCQKKNCAI